MARPKKVATKPAAAKVAPVEMGTAGSLIPVLKSTALSTDVGLKVISWLADADKFDREASQLRESGEAKRYDSLAALTQGIVKAAKADGAINLAAVFEEAKSPAKARLNNQVYLALGFKTTINAGKGKKRFGWTSEISPYVEVDGANDPVAKQKGTVRTNLAHMLTKSIQFAITIIENKIDMKPDKASGTLLLSGPAIKSHFGEASVLLNEKQTVKLHDKKGNVTGEKTLKAKPSFTEIARIGAEAHGKAFKARVDSRAVAVDPAKHIVDLCGMMVKALEKAPKEMNEAMVTALESVRGAIDVLLG